MSLLFPFYLTLLPRFRAYTLLLITFFCRTNFWAYCYPLICEEIIRYTLPYMRIDITPQFITLFFASKKLYYFSVLELAFEMHRFLFEGDFDCEYCFLHQLLKTFQIFKLLCMFNFDVSNTSIAFSLFSLVRALLGTGIYLLVCITLWATCHWYQLDKTTSHCVLLIADLHWIHCPADNAGQNFEIGVR